ncbi:MAG: NFACT family protein, partial [Lachnospiraceae bacterium]
MAFDGTTIAAIVHELNETILNGRISKIAQPETDELILTIKGQLGQERLLLSASASLPLIYLTSENKQSPMTAPNFCMLLRKHIANGRITKIFQPDFERIINFEIEHLNEMGDPAKKNLIVELMGKHSNIIFCDEDGKIIDSIKHISAQTSSVREVLPGRDYFIPKTQEKFNPLLTSEEEFTTAVFSKPVSLCTALYTTYTGISPLIASEICYRAGIDGDLSKDALNDSQRHHLYHMFQLLMEDIEANHVHPNIVLIGEEPLEYAVFELQQYQDADKTYDPSISKILQQFYSLKNSYTRIRQKSVDLRKIVNTALERNLKKYDLQLKQLKDTQKRENYKVYGELIHTYGYQLDQG